MPFKYFVESLELSDGGRVTLSDDDVVILVGPNNAGKSVALREIVACIDAEGSAIPHNKVVKKIECHVTLGTEDLREFLATLDRSRTHPDQVNKMGSQMVAEHLLREGVNPDWVRRALRVYCTYRVTTENRLQITNAVDMIRLDRENKSHPFHYLYDDAALERRISTVFSKAFGTDLIVNRVAGRIVQLHVGTRPESRHDYNVSQEFRDAMAELPPLEEQGDGMRAFVGCLMWATVVDYNVVLIDEPDAFLHPPQARLLGRTLVKGKKLGCQLIMATHSGEFLRGVLDAGTRNVRVMRLTREARANHIHELRPEEISALWADPLLRHSNLLDGLFTSRVVLCEADSDCQFYSAVANAIADSDESYNPPDAMFVHCGGKDRMPKVVSALRAVAVPVTVIADFDVFRDEHPLKALYESLGGSWADIREDWQTVREAISKQKAQLDAADLRKQLESAMSQVTGVTVSDDVLEEIRQAAKKASAWGYAKAMGKHFVPAGPPQIACDRLIASCNTLGLKVVTEGELESFCKDSTMHGPQWVLEVMKRDLARDPALSRAREFVISIFWPH